MTGSEGEGRWDEEEVPRVLWFFRSSRRASLEYWPDWGRTLEGGGSGRSLEEECLWEEEGANEVLLFRREEDWGFGLGCGREMGEES